MTDPNITLCRQWADLYRERGLNPLPSRTDAKRPMCRYAQWWDVLAPDGLFDRFPTTNVQVMCGRPWRLLVMDLDGPEAITRWKDLGRTPRTWISHSGGGGEHHWFRLPEGLDKPIGKAMLWKGDEPHEAIERLCDQSLVMAPPSIHPATGERYRFKSKSESPLGLAMPADCPAWVLRLRPVSKLPVRTRQPLPDESRAASQSPQRYDRVQVLAAIPDKLSLARSWGLRVAGRPNERGWAPCHAIDREDVHPSAAIHAASGSYVDHGSGVKLSLFDLGAQLGVFGDWKEAVNQLGESHA